MALSARFSTQLSRELAQWPAQHVAIMKTPLTVHVLTTSCLVPALSLTRQWLFILEGVPSVVVGILLALFLPESPLTSKWLSDEQKELFKADVGDGLGPCCCALQC